MKMVKAPHAGTVTVISLILMTQLIEASTAEPFPADAEAAADTLQDDDQAALPDPAAWYLVQAVDQDGAGALLAERAIRAGANVASHGWQLRSDKAATKSRGGHVLRLDKKAGLFRLDRRSNGVFRLDKKGSASRYLRLD